MKQWSGVSTFIRNGKAPKPVGRIVSGALLNKVNPYTVKYLFCGRWQLTVSRLVTTSDLLKPSCGALPLQVSVSWLPFSLQWVLTAMGSASSAKLMLEDPLKAKEFSS